MNINLKKLAKQVDEVFAKETKETLAKWLNERRAKRTEPVLNTPVVVDCTTCRWNELKYNEVKCNRCNGDYDLHLPK